jgi:hypothetical protein
VRLARAEAHWLDGKPADARREAELADDAAGGCAAGHHVSAVLAKLGVPTRHAAATRAVRLGLAGTPC